MTKYNRTSRNNYKSQAGSERISMYGYNSNDSLRGSTNNDFIYGGNGDDSLLGNNGNDYLSGDIGNDIINGGTGNDSLAGGNGIDTLVGDTGNDYMWGEQGDDILNGGAGNDILYGGAGNDILYGGDGKDCLNGYGTGGTEYDTLTGNGGPDTFILGGSWAVSYLGVGHATITDFSNAQGDTLQVYGSQSDYSLGKTANLSGGSALDTGIYYQQDLIAVVQDTTDVNLSSNFTFISQMIG
jgi:Ca2+-binding RTX toxin-like protein